MEEVGVREDVYCKTYALAEDQVEGRGSGTRTDADKWDWKGRSTHPSRLSVETKLVRARDGPRRGRRVRLFLLR
jgi:hypothetical protein